MATVRDLYEILGVGRDASAGEIRAAYRKLAQELHPDVNADPADQERFKEVTGAYEILSDPAKRRRYDEFGSGRTARGPVRRHPGSVRRVLRGRLRRSLAGPAVARAPRRGPPRRGPALVPGLGVRGATRDRGRASGHVRAMRRQRRGPERRRSVSHLRRGRGPGRPAEHLRHGDDLDAVRGVRRDRRGDPGSLRDVFRGRPGPIHRDGGLRRPRRGRDGMDLRVAGRGNAGSRGDRPAT